MAKIESIRLYEHTIDCTKDDPTPIKVVLTRFTVDEWIDVERHLAEISSRSMKDAIQEQVHKMVEAAQGGDEDTAQEAAQAAVRLGATGAIDKVQELDRYRVGVLAERWGSVTGLEGVESGEESGALLEHRPILLELWDGLIGASSLSESEKKA